MKLMSSFIFFYIIVFSLSVNAGAFLPPDYVTAWPKKVKVKSPDPVFGEKSYWEYISYSKKFSEVFKGYPADEVDTGLTQGIHAIALRIYKKNPWRRVNSEYPKQYTCEIDVYFDNKFKLPLVERNRKYRSFKSPQGADPTYKRLELKNNDKLKLNNLVDEKFIVAVSPHIYPLPLDGRYSSFGVKVYNPEIIKNMSMIVLAQGLDTCEIVAPLHKDGAHFISLSGKVPFKEHGRSAARGIYDSDVVEKKYHVDESNIQFGNFKLSDNFYKKILPVITLVKTLNICIYKNYTITKAIDKGVAEHPSWKEVSTRCDNIRNKGEISDPWLRSLVEEGITNIGY